MNLPNLKCLLFPQKMAAFGRDELIEEMPADTEQDTSPVVAEESPLSDEEPTFAPATELESNQSVPPKRIDGGAMRTVSSSTSQSWSHPERSNIHYTARKGESRSRSSTPTRGPGCGKAGMKCLTSTLAMTRDELDEDYEPPSQVVPSASKPGKNELHAMALAVTKSSKKGKIVLTKTAWAKLEEKHQSKEDVVRKSAKGGKKSVKSICDQREQVREQATANPGKKRHWKPGTVAL